MIEERTDLGPPGDHTEIAEPAGITNFDHTVEDGVEDRLRDEPVWTAYAGWNFCGRVWFADGAFYCQVWCYGSPVATVRTDSLDALMDEVSGRWGQE